MRMNHGLVPYHDHFSRPPQAATLIGYKMVWPGQVVMNRLQANNGLIFASSVLGLVSPDYAVFESIADTDLGFLTALFRSPRTKAKFRMESKGLGTGTAGFLRLYTDRLGMIPVALPPRDEQTLILRQLDERLLGLQQALARIEREIALLREYRTRLIADVMTGKLDVREAARGLPEELEEEAGVEEEDVGTSDEESPEMNLADEPEETGV